MLYVYRIYIYIRKHSFLSYCTESVFSEWRIASSFLKTELDRYTIRESRMYMWSLFSLSSTTVRKLVLGDVRTCKHEARRRQRVTSLRCTRARRACRSVRMSRRKREKKKPAFRASWQERSIGIFDIPRWGVQWLTAFASLHYTLNVIIFVYN